jgi:hypothetical protein
MFGASADKDEAGCRQSGVDSLVVRPILPLNAGEAPVGAESTAPNKPTEALKTNAPERRLDRYFMIWMGKIERKSG